MFAKLNFVCKIRIFIMCKILVVLMLGLMVVMAASCKDNAPEAESLVFEPGIDGINIRQQSPMSPQQIELINRDGAVSPDDLISVAGELPVAAPVTGPVGGGDIDMGGPMGMGGFGDPNS